MTDYDWSGPAGFVDPGNAQCTGPINIAGTYQVIITDEEGCKDTCDRPLVVYPQPECVLTGDSTIC
jgi:hypothetical protein